MRLAAVRATLPESAAALRRSHGGTGALLLAPPMNGHHLVPDEELIVAVCGRLSCSLAVAVGAGALGEARDV